MYNYDENELKSKLGKLLTKKRQAHKLSQEKLAEKMNVHVRTISKIENGHSFVSAETLCKLCQFFNLPPKSFFDIDKISDRRNKKLNELIDKLKTSDKEKIEFYYNLINLVDNELNK
ncbi:helix-turn-helix transcriptional regulator [bacterium]|nr:helix-turn-helix transcriptional regulator [bacterium]